MGVLIKGMELPKTGNVSITIYSDGAWCDNKDNELHGKAIELLPHGDWHTGIPTEDGDYIVCMSDSISTPMHVPCAVRDGKPFISMMYDTKQRTIRAYMPFKPYMR